MSRYLTARQHTASHSVPYQHRTGSTKHCTSLCSSNAHTEVARHSGRTSVSGRRTSPVPRSTCSGWTTTAVGKPSAANSAFHPSRSIKRAPALIGWDKGGNVTSARWQVTLCDPIWHVSSCSRKAFANCYIRIYFTC